MSLNFDYVQITTPKTLSLFFASANLYNMLIKVPIIPDCMPNPRDQLKYWASSFHKSKILFGLSSLLGGILGCVAYQKNNNKFFLAGGLVSFSIILYTYAFMQKINKYLLEKDREAKEQLSAQDHDDVVLKLKQWYSRHKVRLILSILSALLFYRAQEIEFLKKK